MLAFKKSKSNVWQRKNIPKMLYNGYPSSKIVSVIQLFKLKTSFSQFVRHVNYVPKIANSIAGMQTV
jgi:hypothetical protein